jgi:hypothetical protein
MDGNAAFDPDVLARFFDHFRQRLTVLDRLYVDPTAEPECHVLVAAALEALASHWWGTFNEEKIHHGPRVQAFLRVCGQTSMFDRCCRSELLKFADDHAARHPELPRVMQRLLREKKADRSVESWRGDPLLAQVQQHLSAAGIALDAGEARQLKSARYGHALYGDYRSVWIHATRCDARSADGRQQPGQDQPWVQNTSLTDAIGNLLPGIERRLVLPWDFLRSTLEECINGFEWQCRVNGTLPRALRH